MNEDSDFISGSAFILRLINRTDASKTAGGILASPIEI